MRLGIFVIASIAWAQQPAEFDVATIKPSAPQTDGRTHVRMSSDTSTGDLHYSNVNLKQVIARAYNVQQYQVSGPDWIETERFDIVAKFPPRAKPDRLPLMLQSLLAGRFKLTIHRETKELPIYSLVVAKGGPKFKAVDSASGITTNSNRTRWHVTAKVSMTGLAEFLTDEAGRPVIDNTGLKGAYDLTLDWAVDDSPTVNDSTTGPSLFTAVQEQLGLKLESAKGPVETIVVDSAERTPTEN